MAYSVVFRDHDKTLEEAEITATMKKILNGLTDTGNRAEKLMKLIYCETWRDRVEQACIRYRASADIPAC